MKFVIYISINGGVLINVLGKQTEDVKIYFVIYLEKIKKQSRTKVFFGVTKSCAQVFFKTNVCLTPLSAIFQLYLVGQCYW